MRQIAAFAPPLCTVLPAADKRPPEGLVEDESVSIAATILDAEHIRQAVGSDFNGQYSMLEMRVAPKGGLPLDVRIENGQETVLQALKNAILEETITADPVSGLLFPLAKEKPKNLVLSCTTPKCKRRLRFK